MAHQDFNRRDLLIVAGTGEAVAVGMQAIKPARAAGDARKGEHQWAMVIDQSECIGCGYCTLACQAHNEFKPSASGSA